MSRCCRRSFSFFTSSVATELLVLSPGLSDSLKWFMDSFTSLISFCETENKNYGLFSFYYHDINHPQFLCLWKVVVQIFLVQRWMLWCRPLQQPPGQPTCLPSLFFSQFRMLLPMRSHSFPRPAPPCPPPRKNHLVSPHHSSYILVPVAFHFRIKFVIQFLPCLVGKTVYWIFQNTFHLC